MLGQIHFKNCSTGIDFENRIVEILNRLGFDARRVGTNDSGIDIIATYVTEPNPIVFNIQCKYYNNTLSKAPIQEVYSGTHYRDNGGHPVVITNNAVTATARQFAKKLGVEIIADMEWQEFVRVAKTKIIYNPNPHNGLFGIILSKVAGNKQYFINTVNAIAKANENKEQTKPTEKDKLRADLITDFDEAESCIQEAAYLQQKAAMFSQRALSLQKKAILKNLDYG